MPKPKPSARPSPGSSAADLPFPELDVSGRPLQLREVDIGAFLHPKTIAVIGSHTCLTACGAACGGLRDHHFGFCRMRRERVGVPRERSIAVSFVHQVPHE